MRSGGGASGVARATISYQISLVHDAVGCPPGSQSCKERKQEIVFRKKVEPLALVRDPWLRVDRAACPPLASFASIKQPFGKLPVFHADTTAPVFGFRLH